LLMFIFIKKLYRAYKYMEEAEVELLKAYERGKAEAITAFKSQVVEYNKRIAELTEETLHLDEKLRRIYEERISAIDQRWTKRCQMCSQHVEQERNRLRTIQNAISKYMNEFTLVFNKLFKHAVFVETAHDTMLTSAAQVKASKEMLNGIKAEAQNIINQVEPLLRVEENENNITNILMKDTSELTTEETGKL